MSKKSAIFASIFALVFGLASITAPAASAPPSSVGKTITNQTQSAPKGLKVFVSVDMEGVCGVVNWDDVTVGGTDYGLFRKLMTMEANAAIAGALAAGATEIVVRDAHDTGRNILPDLLKSEARLLRAWSYGPLSMMEGIDKTFDAVIFIGYHARASTPNAVLKHTMSTALLDVIINGKKMPEAGINGLMAGYFGVPVVLISGDQAIASLTMTVSTLPKSSLAWAAIAWSPEMSTTGTPK
jgi:D-aminopeptidase